MDQSLSSTVSDLNITNDIDCKKQVLKNTSYLRQLVLKFKNQSVQIDTLKSQFELYRNNINEQINKGDLAIRMKSIESDVNEVIKLKDEFIDGIKQMKKVKNKIDEELLKFEERIQELLEFLDEFKKSRQDFADLTSEFSKFQSEITNIYNKFIPMENQIQQNVNEIDNLNDLLTDYKNELNDLKQKHNEEIEELRNESLKKAIIDQLKDEFNDQLQHLKEEIQRDYENKIKESQTDQNNKMKKKINKINNNLNQLKKDFDNSRDYFNEEIGDCKSEITSITNLVAENKSAIEDTNKNLTDELKIIKDKLSDQQNQINILNDSSEKFEDFTKKISEEDLPNLQDQIDQNKNFFDDFEKKTKQNEEQIIEQINLSTTNIDTRIKKIVNELEKFKKQVNASFQQNKNQHDEINEKLAKHEQQIDNQENEIEKVSDQTSQFITSIDEQFVKFRDNSENRFNEAQTKAELTRKSVDLRCKLLEEDINKIKNDINQVKNDTSLNLAQFQNVIKQSHEENKEDHAEFKRYAEGFIEEMNYKRDEIKEEITEWNKQQFQNIDIKINNIYDSMRTLQPNGDFNAGLLIDKMKNQYEELRNKIDTLISEDRLNKELKNSISRINNDFTDRLDQISIELEQIRDNSASSLTEQIGKIREKINNLETESAKQITQSIDDNQKILQENTQNLMLMITNIQNTSKNTSDSFTEFQHTFGEDFITAKEEIKKMNDLIKLNQEESIKRDNNINDLIQQSLDDIQSNAVLNFQKELKDIQDQINEVNGKCTQSKIAEDNLQKNINDADLKSKAEITALQTKLNNTVDQINNDLENKIRELTTKISRIQSFYELLKGDSEIDFPTLINNLYSIQEQIDAKVGSCTQAINKVHNSLSSEIKKVNDLNIAETAKVTKLIEDSRTESSKSIAQATIDLNNRLNSTSSAIQENVLNLSKQITEFIGVDKIKVIDIINMIQKLRNDCESGDSLVLKTAQEQDDFLQDQIRQLSDQLVQYSEKVEQTFKSTKSKTDDKIKKVQEELEKCVSKIRELMTEMNNEISRISDNGKLTLPLIVAQMEEVITSTFDSFTKTQDSMKELHDSLKEKLKQVKKELIEIKDGSEDISLSSLNARIEQNKNSIDEFKSQQEEFIEISNSNFHQSEMNHKTKIDKLEDLICSFEKKLENQIENFKTTAMVSDEKYSGKFDDIYQQIEKVASNADSKSQERMNEVIEKFNELSELNLKVNEEFSNRQTNLEERIENNEKAFEKNVSSVNGKLVEKIGIIETRLTKNIDEKSSELRERIRIIENKVSNNPSLAAGSINSALEFYIEETNKLKIELTKIKGQSDSDDEENVELESLATLSQILKKMKDSNEARFKSIEDRNLTLNEAFAKSSTEINSKLIDGDKVVQSQVDHIKIQLQNLEENMSTSSEVTIKDLNDKYSKLEHTVTKNETVFNTTIESIQARLDTTIQMNESNSKSQFESINTNLEELTKTVNNDRNTIEKVVNQTTQRIDEYFKKDNESIRQTVNDMNDKLNKKVSKIIDACNLKFTDIDNTTASITNDHENAIIAVKLLIESSESRLKEMITSTDKSLASASQSLTHQIELISQRSEEIQKVVSLNEEIEKKDFLKLQTDINNNQANNNASFDQMMAVIKSHLDKRKQEIKKISNKMQLQFQQVAEEISSSNSQITKNAIIAKENLENMIGDFRKENDASLANQKAINSSVSKKLKEITQDVATKIKPSISEANDKITATKEKIDSFEEMLRNHQVKNNQSFSEIDEEFNRIKNSIENSQNFLKEKIEIEKKLLLDKNAKTMQQIESIASDYSKVQSKIDSILIEINDLKRVHFYNAEMETFSIKFDEVLKYIEKYKEIICNFVHSSFLATSLVPLKGDPRYTQATIGAKEALSEIEKVIQNEEKKKSSQKEDDFKVIENLKDGIEIGRIIRDELKSNIAVKVIIPKSTRVVWNKTVQISPHQKVTIIGDDKETSIIQMTGLETFGGVPISVNLNSEENDTVINNSNEYIYVSDPSRCLIDGFSSLLIKNVRIEAVCTTNINEQEDLKALFVCRGWDAIGPSIVQLINCAVNSDHSVVNVGGNAFTHIQFDSCRISNNNVNNDEKSSFETIYPVTAESGAYPNGYGVIANKGTVLAGRGIEWMNSLFLINSESNVE